MLKTLIISTLMLFTSTTAIATPLVDCNKVSSMAAAGVFKLYQGVSLGKVLSVLPQSAEKASLNAAELIVATGIISNVNAQGVKPLIDSLTTETNASKLISTRNAFYMFCQDAFVEKNYY